MKYAVSLLLLLFPALLYAQPRPLLQESPARVAIPTPTNYYVWPVAHSADFNHDGLADLLARGQKGSGFNAEPEVAVLIWGTPQGLSPDVAWVSERPAGASQWFAEQISAAGDVNGDGYQDILVSDRGEEVTSQDPNDPRHTIYTSQGTVYLYLGGPTGPSTTPAWSKSEPDSHYGASLAPAGDVNGDGYDDVLVGTPGDKVHHRSRENGCDHPGVVYLYLGSATGLGVDAAWSFRNQPEGCLGFYVDGGGDINGDGYDDVFISAVNYPHPDGSKGQVYGFYGSSSGLSLTPSWEPPLPSDIVEAIAFGFPVRLIGDVNGDGYDDVLVKSLAYHMPDDDPHFKHYLYRGASAGLPSAPEMNTLDGSVGSLVGFLGKGDINNDGLADILLEGMDPTPVMSSLFHGSSQLPYIGPYNAFEISGQISSTRGYGRPTSHFADYNGDGYDDLVVRHRHNFMDELVVLHGGPNPAPIVSDQRVEGPLNQPLTITLEASDLHEDLLTLALSDWPSHGTLSAINRFTGQLTYTPRRDFVGEDRFTFTATDPYGNQSSAQVTVILEQTNRAPSFAQPPPASVVVSVGETASFTVVGMDPDGDDLTYGYAPEVEGATMDELTGVFSYTPLDDQVGFAPISVILFDGFTSFSAEVILQVLPRDSDEDGVPDAQDECPDEVGPVERMGCPEGPEDMGTRDMGQDMGSVEDMTPADAGIEEPEDMEQEQDMAQPEEEDLGQADMDQQDTQDDDGCGCQAVKPKQSSWLWAVLLLGFFFRRRWLRVRR